MQQSKLLQFAEVCLSTYYAEFKLLLDDAQNKKITTSDFIKKYPMFEHVWADLKEVEAVGVSFGDDELLFIVFLIFAENKKLMFQVNWSGEEENGDIVKFIKQILELRNIAGFEWDTEEFNASLDLKKIGRGDYIPILFKAVDQKLQKIGCRLAFFCMGDKSYNFTVLNEADFNKVHRLAWACYGIYGVDSMNEYEDRREEMMKE
ncbi:MAG: hypothetical protein LBG58_07260 [Planctomycetaceae bacterium]|jgi:hypothetical protein|nr:hypothetical protein [Planctomycetaceae bacterium]